jgi:hypothetical protein
MAFSDPPRTLPAWAPSVFQSDPRLPAQHLLFRLSAATEGHVQQLHTRFA